MVQKAPYLEQENEVGMDGNPLGQIRPLSFSQGGRVCLGYTSPSGGKTKEQAV